MGARLSILLAFLALGWVLPAQTPPLGRPGRAPKPPSALEKLFEGQRRALDANLPSIVLRGTRERGLERSVDGGASWNLVRSFPAMPLNGIGITLVAFAKASGVPGQPTPVIFVGVADPIGNLFWSRDGGKSWKTVLGGPAGVYPVSARFGADGWMELDFVGLDGVHGAVTWGLEPRTGAWRKGADR